MPARAGRPVWVGFCTDVLAAPVFTGSARNILFAK